MREEGGGFDLAWRQVMADETARLKRGSLLAVLGCGAAALGLFAFAVGLGGDNGWIVAISVAVAFAAIPLRLLVSYRLARPLLLPLAEIAAWTVDRSRRQWRAVDGGLPPLGSDVTAETLRRLHGRHDDLSSYLRVRALSRAGEFDAASSALDAWQPTNPLAAVTRARAREDLAYKLSAADALDDLRALAYVLPSGDSEAQLALIDVDEGTRRAERGESFVDAFLSARRRLRSLDFETLAPLENPLQVRRRSLTLIAASALIPLAILAIPLAFPSLPGALALLFLVPGALGALLVLLARAWMS